MWDFLDKLCHVLFARWLYSDAMHDYLSGYGPEGDDTIYLNRCVLFWFIALGAGALISFLYYKVIDRPSWARAGKWLLLGLAAGLLVMICTAGVLWDQWMTPDTLLSNMAFSGDDVWIDFIDIIGVSFAQFLLTFIFYFLWSLLFKRLSYSCRYIPFK